jgi:hypothetical protein
VEDSEAYRRIHGVPLPVAREELHLLYVAVTRAKSVISGPGRYFFNYEAVRKFTSAVEAGKIKLD